jgi:hypothetical protein
MLPMAAGLRALPHGARGERDLVGYLQSMAGNRAYEDYATRGRPVLPEFLNLNGPDGSAVRAAFLWRFAKMVLFCHRSSDRVAMNAEAAADSVVTGRA